MRMVRFFGSQTCGLLIGLQTVMSPAAAGDDGCDHRAGDADKLPEREGVTRSHAASSWDIECGTFDQPGSASRKQRSATGSKSAIKPCSAALPVAVSEQHKRR